MPRSARALDEDAFAKVARAANEGVAPPVEHAWDPDDIIWDSVRMIATVMPSSERGNALTGANKRGQQAARRSPEKDGNNNQRICKVSGCARLACRPHEKRKVICFEHRKARAVLVDGHLARFCQVSADSRNTCSVLW